MVEADHDLLVRIDEKLKGLQADFSGERIASATRFMKTESDNKELWKEVDSLRLSWAKLTGAMIGISFIISTLVKVFWK